MHHSPECDLEARHNALCCLYPRAAEAHLSLLDRLNESGRVDIEFALDVLDGLTGREVVVLERIMQSFFTANNLAEISADRWLSAYAVVVQILEPGTVFQQRIEHDLTDPIWDRIVALVRRVENQVELGWT